jgi:hypothetical protein
VDGIVFVIGSGVANLSTLRRARRMLRLATKPPSSGRLEKVLVDLRQARLDVTWRDWRQLQRETERECHDWRLGLLVDHRHRGPVWEFCRSMVAEGHTRLLFASQEKAEEWTGLELPRSRELVTHSVAS